MTTFDDGRRTFLRRLAQMSVIASAAVGTGGSTASGAARGSTMGAGTSGVLNQPVCPRLGDNAPVGRTPSDFIAMKKIDIHTHISTDAAYLREVMDALNMKMFTICNEGLKVERLRAQNPNLAMETSSCIGALMDQSRPKIRAFFRTYQDRLIYGADISGGLIPTPYLIDMSRIDERLSSGEIERAKRALLRRYRSDFTYYATDHMIDRGTHHIRGLALPENVLRKVFYENAVRWVPGLADDF